MNPFVRFMNTTLGRIVRVISGAALIGTGLMAIGGVSGLLVAALGAVPLAAGLFDSCVFAPIFRTPFSGAKIRMMK